MIQEFIAAHPVILQMFIFLGGVSLVVHTLALGVPRLLAWLMPLALRIGHGATIWLLSKTIIREAILSNREKVEAVTDALFDGLEEILNAVQAEVKETIGEAATGQAPTPPLPAPPPPPAQ